MTEARTAEIIYFDNSFDRYEFDDAALAFGVFDGVHKGHSYIVGETIKAAQRDGGNSIILTFDKDPDELFRPEEVRKLLTNEERISALASLGADKVVVLPFTTEFASRDPYAFLEYLFGCSAPLSVHIGCDFRFGKKASGTTAELEFWAGRSGASIFAYALEQYEGLPITATRIRNLIADGDTKTANLLLGKPFSFSAVVEAGRGEGSEMGIATANMMIPPCKGFMAEGVYCAYAHTLEGVFKAAVNIGIPVSFAETAKHDCEAHLLDYSGDLYGQEIKLEFIEYLRPMKVFDSTDELVKTIISDITYTRGNL